MWKKLQGVGSAKPRSSAEKKENEKGKIHCGTRLNSKE